MSCSTHNMTTRGRSEYRATWYEPRRPLFNFHRTRILGQPGKMEATPGTIVALPHIRAEIHTQQRQRAIGSKQILLLNRLRPGLLMLAHNPANLMCRPRRVVRRLSAAILDLPAPKLAGMIPMERKRHRHFLQRCRPPLTTPGNGGGNQDEMIFLVNDDVQIHPGKVIAGFQAIPIPDGFPDGLIA